MKKHQSLAAIMHPPAETISENETDQDPATDFRSRFLAIETGLAGTRSLFRFAAIMTGAWACILLLTTLLHPMRHRVGDKPGEALPSLLQGYLSVSQLTLGGITAFLFAVYFLFNAAEDELRPGRGKRHTRVLALTLLAFIAIFWLFPLGLLFTLEPAYWILNRRSKTVLSAEYAQIVDLTPHLTARIDGTVGMAQRLRIVLVIAAAAGALVIALRITGAI